MKPCAWILVLTAMVGAFACRREKAPASDEPPPPSTSSSSSSKASCSRPVEEEWAEHTDGEMKKAIAAAKTCAKARGVRVLLAFGAPWCADCREMLRLDQEKRVAAVLRERYEVVRINVGDWDRHAELREKFGVKAIAHYVVLDPATDAVVAQTTLEPMTGGGEVTAEIWEAWLRKPKTVE